MQFNFIKMNTNSIYRNLLFIFAISLLTAGCNNDNPENFQINPEFQKHISSFTSGVISAAARIKIQLTEPYSKKITPNQAIKDDFIKISPSVKGKTVWIDQYTIQFIPDENFKSGETY